MVMTHPPSIIPVCRDPLQHQGCGPDAPIRLSGPSFGRPIGR